MKLCNQDNVLEPLFLGYHDHGVRNHIWLITASGLVSASRHMSLLKDAFDAGVDACYSEVANKERHSKPHSLLLEILNENKWPVPLQHKSGQAVPGKLAFLLPHELLFALVANSPEGSSCFEETDGLHSTTFAHVLKTSQSWQKPLVAINLWQDAVPYNWGRSESLEVYSWSLPGLNDPKTRNMRFPVVVCPNHWAVKETHTQIMEVLSWSFAALAEGRWHSMGHMEVCGTILTLAPLASLLLAWSSKETGRC